MAHTHQGRSVGGSRRKISFLLKRSTEQEMPFAAVGPFQVLTGCLELQQPSVSIQTASLRTQATRSGDNRENH